MSPTGLFPFMSDLFESFDLSDDLATRTAKQLLLDDVVEALLYASDSQESDDYLIGLMDELERWISDFDAENADTESEAGSDTEFDPDSLIFL
jgi:hypothetical protein